MKYKELLKAVAAWDGPYDAEVFFVNYDRQPICKDKFGHDVYAVTSVGTGIKYINFRENAILLNNFYED